MAVFIIHTTFTLISRSCFVLAGNILSGTISKGMAIKLSGENIIVDSVEAIEDSENKALVGLLIKADRHEAARLDNLFYTRQEIKLV